MEVELTPWDSAEVIRNEEELAAYLAVVLEEDGGPTIYASSIAVAARARGGVSTLAQESGLNEAELSDAIQADEEHALPVVQRLEQAYHTRIANRMVA